MDRVLLYIFALLCPFADGHAKTHADLAVAKALDEVWILIENFQFDHASALLSTMEGVDKDMRTLASVITETNADVITKRSSQHVRDQLGSLITKGHSAVRPVAMYLLARHYAFDPIQPDLNKTLHWYSRLMTEYPERFFGQLACLKYATILLYYPQGGESFDDRLAEARDFMNRIRLREIQVAFNLLIGDAINYNDGDPHLASSHYIEAFEGGIINERRRKDILIQIGESAMAASDYDTAIKYYSLFVENYPNEKRTYTVIEKIEGLSGGNN